jgi:hypothetical protein
VSPVMKAYKQSLSWLSGTQTLVASRS